MAEFIVVETPNLNSSLLLKRKVCEDLACSSISFNTKRFSFSKVDDLKEVFEFELNSGTKFLVLDFSDLETIGSVQIGLLMVTLRSFRKIGGDLLLSNVPEHIVRILNRMGVLRAIKAFQTSEDALENLQN